MDDPIIRYADRGDGPVFDEFIAHDATIHVEQMSECSWWIGVTLPDGRLWHINVGSESTRVKGRASCEAQQ